MTHSLVDICQFFMYQQDVTEVNRIELLGVLEVQSLGTYIWSLGLSSIHFRSLCYNALHTVDTGSDYIKIHKAYMS